MFFMVLPFGLYCVCFLVYVVPYLVIQLHCITGHRLRSDSESGLTSGLM